MSSRRTPTNPSSQGAEKTSELGDEKCPAHSRYFINPGSRLCPLALFTQASERSRCASSGRGSHVRSILAQPFASNESLDKSFKLSKLQFSLLREDINCRIEDFIASMRIVIVVSYSFVALKEISVKQLARFLAVSKCNKII